MWATDTTQPRHEMPSRRGAAALNHVHLRNVATRLTMARRSKRAQRAKTASPIQSPANGDNPRQPKRNALWIYIAAAVLVAAAIALYYIPRPDTTIPAPLTALPAEPVTPKAQAAPEFISETGCATCHQQQYDEWRNSQHALAMQDAKEGNVLGDFNDASYRMRGVTTRLFRRDGAYLVNTEGEDGKPRDFRVRYAFGVTPLQQYLVEFTGGRLQALPVAWDTVNRRWFHLYPDEKIDHQDELHWTQPAHNWNFMCAECHSTGVKKNYDYTHDRYETSYFQVNIGCQGCHGPASTHVAWASGGSGSTGNRSANLAETGFQVDLKASDSRIQIEACARCHSRRSVIAPDYQYGKRLMDTHLPALLEDSLYYADGQIEDEVYVYGSFLQSKMAAKGLRCSDCHNPHTATLKAEGNALCVKCHNDSTPKTRPGIEAGGLKKKNYDGREHHFHEPGTPGSRCIDCHAPKTTYMVIDPRADHSFRIPRPDLTEKIGTPNACNGCHPDRTPSWAVEVIRNTHPEYRPEPHYGEALAAGRDGKLGAVKLLADVAGNPGYPAIVRASALELLGRYPGEISQRLISAGLRDPDPLVRRAAAGGLQSTAPEPRAQLLSPLLTDPVLAVRLEAARLLAAAPAELLDAASRRNLDAAIEELESSYRVNLDRPEGRINFGNLYFERGEFDKAEAYYRSALDVGHASVAAIVNFADFYRATGRESEAEKILRGGLASYPNNPAICRSLALSLVRQQRKSEALALLGQSLKATGDTELSYLYALALDDSGQTRKAIEILEEAFPRAHGNRSVLLLLAALHAKSEHSSRAAAFLKILAEINPADPALQ